jgi:ankyrin repeat protein
MYVRSEDNSMKNEGMKIDLKTLMMAPWVILVLTLVIGCDKPQDGANPPSVGLQEAAAQGDLPAVKQHIAAGSNLEERDPLAGSTPLIAAAVFGRVEVARALIEAGADVNAKNNEGSTPLHSAAFLCHPEIVEALLANGADKSVRNNVGATALDSVAGPFEDVQGIYDLLAGALGPFGLQLDYERIKATRPKVATMLR